MFNFGTCNSSHLATASNACCWRRRRRGHVLQILLDEESRGESVTKAVMQSSWKCCFGGTSGPYSILSQFNDGSFGMLSGGRLWRHWRITRHSRFAPVVLCNPRTGEFCLLVIIRWDFLPCWGWMMFQMLSCWRNSGIFADPFG